MKVQSLVRISKYIWVISVCLFDWILCADDSEVSDIPTESNVRKDLNEWQVKHASLVLSTVKVSSVLLTVCKL